MKINYIKRIRKDISIKESNYFILWICLFKFFGVSYLVFTTLVYLKSKNLKFAHKKYID